MTGCTLQIYHRTSAAMWGVKVVGYFLKGSVENTVVGVSRGYSL